MKTILTTITALTALGLWASATARADNPEKSLKGEGLCAKCELKETEKCQTAIRVQDGGKTAIYYAEGNRVALDFHKNICATPSSVVATGAVKEADGKQHITLSKIELDGKK